MTNAEQTKMITDLQNSVNALTAENKETRELLQVESQANKYLRESIENLIARVKSSDSTINTVASEVRRLVSESIARENSGESIERENNQVTDLAARVEEIRAIIGLQ